MLGRNIESITRNHETVFKKITAAFFQKSPDFCQPFKKQMYLDLKHRFFSEMWKGRADNGVPTKDKHVFSFSGHRRIILVISNKKDTVLIIWALSGLKQFLVNIYKNKKSIFDTCTYRMDCANVVNRLNFCYNPFTILSINGFKKWNGTK